MIFYLNDDRFRYELEKLSRLFLPFEKFQFTEFQEETVDSDEYVKVWCGDRLLTELKLDGKHEIRQEDRPCKDDFTELERTLALMLFDCFQKVTGYRSPWGILTGVRPAKLIGKLISEDGEQAATDYFKNVLLVSAEKTQLCLECHKSCQQYLR